MFCGGQTLDPDRVFAEHLVINRRELRDYEKTLKEELKQWAQKGMNTEVYT